VVQNVRCGSIVITKESGTVAVSVELASPYLTKGKPLYIPRPKRKRQKWNLYSCALGTFTDGFLEGIVTLRYHDKSTYEVMCSLRPNFAPLSDFD